MFGDRWTLLVIRDLLLGKKTYGQFLDSPEKIATNILAQRLAWLEKQKIITKSRDPQHRQKRIYRLAPKGRDLLPILLEMILWGAKHDPASGAPAKIVRRIKYDRVAVTKEILARA
jgi:DNA-binding HxlR family transcriptional regulator